MKLLYLKFGTLKGILNPTMKLFRAFQPTSVTKISFPGGSEGKASACNAGDPGSIPGSGKSPGEGNGNPSSFLTWRIARMEQPGGLQFTGGKLSDFTFPFGS